MRTRRLIGMTNSLRPASLNRMALALVEELLPAHCRMEWVDLRPIPFYDADLESQGLPQSVLSLADALAQGDGLVITSPEYNHSLPAVLKNAIDWLSRVPKEPLDGMPVMLVSATPGLLGGARMQYDLRRVLDAVGALPLVRPEVFIGQATAKFDSQGRCIDARTRELVGSQLRAFEEWIDRIGRPARALAA